MSNKLKFSVLLMLAVGFTLAGCKENEATKANPELGRALTGEWAYADLRYADNQDPAIAWFAHLGNDLVLNTRTNYRFEEDGTYRTQVWNTQTNSFKDSQVGTWRIMEDGETVEVTTEGNVVKRFRVKATDNELLLYAYNGNQAQTDVAMVLIQPQNLPELDSEADRERRKQLRYAAFLAQANAPIGNTLDGEWAFADLQYSQERNSLQNLLRTLGTKLTTNVRTHYVFNTNGTCTTRTWHNARNTMMDKETGNWRVLSDGRTIAVTLGRGDAENFTVRNRGNERLLFAYDNNQPQTEVAMVMVRANTLPAPDSPADRERRRAQVRSDGNQLGSDIGQGVSELGESIDSSFTNRPR